MGIFGTKAKTFEEYLREQKKKAKWFIAQLVKGGVPRSAIATNDFNTNLTPRVYITIPYGRPGGGRDKGYERWNLLTVKQAIRFYKTAGYRKPKGRR